MMFKKNKTLVIQDASSAAHIACYNILGNVSLQNTTPHELQNMIQNSIESAIREAIESLVNNKYTDQEFEEDIGLTEKNK
jgi:hypothetical protein